jgi:FkbM family methyltransferase
MDAILQEAQGKGWGYAGTRHEVAAIATVMRKYEVQTPRVVLDVGANVGEWAEIALGVWPTTQLLCFEPSTHAAELLRHRFADHGNVEVVEAALGNRAGSATLFADDPGSALGSLHRRRLDHFDVELHAQQSVSVLTLDAFLHQRSMNDVDVIKLDVEGCEMDVLEGASYALSLARLVQFEWGEASTGSRIHWVDMWYFWRDRGWQLYRIAPRGPIHVRRYHPRDEVMTWTNYVAVRA